MSKAGLPRSQYLLISIPQKVSVPGIETPIEIRAKDIIENAVCPELADSICLWSLPGGNYSQVGLRGGTMDNLYSLLEELNKSDSFVESTLKKAGRTLLDLCKKSERSDFQWLIEEPIEDCIRDFQWSQQRFPLRKTLNELLEMIRSEVLKIDERLRKQIAVFSSIQSIIKQKKKKEVGPLVSRDITKLVNKSDFIESDYLTSLFVVVPTVDSAKWNKCYETLTEHVLPRSTLTISQDRDAILYRAVLFKRDIDEFKNKCSENRWTVKKYEAATSESEEDFAKLKDKKDRKKKSLKNNCIVDFAEIFIHYLHLKFIRCYIESVLRYGLPPSFNIIIIFTKENKIPKIHKTLRNKFPLSDFGKVEADDDIMVGNDEHFYPYVTLEMNLDLKYSK